MIILAILGFGFLMGWLAQLVLGLGTRPHAQSLIAGLLGSVVGGTLLNLIVEGNLHLKFSGFIGSFLGAIIVLLIWGLVGKRTKAS
ncbi:hypothetical protein BH10ACT3_BH10ACT3_17540 [soil metagenome]